MKDVEFKSAPKQLSEVKYEEVAPHVFKFAEPFEVRRSEWRDAFRDCICLGTYNWDTDMVRVHYFCDTEEGNHNIRPFRQKSLYCICNNTMDVEAGRWC